MDTTLNINVGMKASGPDPFAKAAESAKAFTAASKAAEMQAKLNRDVISDAFSRMDKLKDKLMGTGSGSAMARDQVEKFFGISEIDKSMKRAQQSVQDGLKRLQIQAGRIDVDANPMPFLTAVRRMEGQVGQFKRIAQQGFMEAFGGFSKASGGIQQLASGLSMLSSGDEGVEKVVKKMLMLNAVFDTLKGAKATIQGLVGGFINLTKAVGTMQTASGLAEQFGQVTNDVRVQLLGKTQQTQQTAFALRQLAADTQHASQASREFSKTLREGGPGGGGGRGGAGGGIGSFTGAASGGFAGDVAEHFKSDGTPSWRGFGLAAAGLAGAIAGGYIGNAIGGDTGMAIGGAIGGVVGPLSPSIWGAATKGLGFLATGLGATVPVLAGAAAAATAMGLAVKSMTEALDRSAESAARLRRIEGRIGGIRGVASATGYAIGELDAIQNREQSIARNQPITSLERQLADRQFEARFAQLGVSGIFAGRDVQDSRSLFDTARDAFMQPNGMTAEGFGAFGQAQGRLSAALIEENPSFVLQRDAIANQITQRQDARNRLSPVDRLIELRNQEQALPAVGLQDSTNADWQRRQITTEQHRLIQQMGLGEMTINEAINESLRRREQLQQEILDLTERQGKLSQQERQRQIQALESQRAFHQDQERFARQQAQSLRQQQRGDESNFGLMSDEARNRAIHVAQRMRDFFGGNGQDNFTEEDLATARSVPQLRLAIEELGRRRAARDGRFAQLEGFALPGQLNRQQQIERFEGMAGQNREIAVNVENTIRATIQADALETARELANQLAPAYNQMMATMRQAIEERFRIEEANKLKASLLAASADPNNQK